MSDVVVYGASLVIPITAPPIVDGAVAVRDGRILHVGDRPWVVARLAERGLAFTEVTWDGVLMPGLVNAHTHLQYSGMGQVGAGRYRDFADWVRAFNPAYAAHHDWAADADAGAAQAIAAGTTAVADVVTDAPAARALHRAGLHGITYWEVMDWSNDRWAGAGGGTPGRSYVEAALDALPSPPGTGLSPHAPYSLEIDALLEIPDIVRERGARLHIHLGESEIERAFDHEQAGPGNAGTPWHLLGLASLTEVRAAGLGISATDYVDHLGVLGPDCHIAHGVYMTADDRALLRARHTAVALCPRSNAVIGLDEPPVAAYLNEGSPIAVGTDSLASSESLDVLADVALLARLARAQGYSRADLAHRLLGAATLGGARAMGLDLGPDRTGHLAVGARADLAFLDVPRSGVSDAGVATTLEDVVSGGAGTAAATVIAGRLRATSASFTHQTGATA